MSESLQHRVVEQWERDPSRRVIGFYDSHGRQAWRTAEEFSRAALGYGAALRDAGLEPGGVCLLVLPSGELSATLLTATVLLGGVPLLVAPPGLQGAQSSLGEIVARTARRTRARLVVVDDAMGATTPAAGARAGPRWIPAARLTADSGAPPPPLARPEGGAVAALQLTSGTTGFPRICLWRHRGLLAALDGMRAALGLGSNDLLFNWTPLYHDMGLVNNFFLCLAHGVPLALMSPTDFVRHPALWLRGLTDTGATQTWSPNFGYALAAQRAAADDLAGVRLDGVRAFWNAAERIHWETVRAFHARFQPYGARWEALKANFGCAENVGGATFTPLDRPMTAERVDPDTLYRRRVARPLGPDDAAANGVWVVSAGRPYHGLRVRILSPRGRRLPDGEVGEVALETPSRMDGYLGDARATARARCGPLLRTGDLGYTRDGEFFWTGRVRERITIRGRKLDPSDFEHALLGIAGLRKGCFAAFGVDDGGQGTQRLVIVAEAEPAPALDAADLATQVRTRVFAQFSLMVDDVVLVKKGTLTKTSSGKRRHRHFRELYLRGRLAPYLVNGKPR